MPVYCKKQKMKWNGRWESCNQLQIQLVNQGGAV